MNHPSLQYHFIQLEPFLKEDYLENHPIIRQYDDYLLPLEPV